MNMKTGSAAKALALLAAVLLLPTLCPSPALAHQAVRTMTWGSNNHIYLQLTAELVGGDQQITAPGEMHVNMVHFARLSYRGVTGDTPTHSTAKVEANAQIEAPFGTVLYLSGTTLECGEGITDPEWTLEKSQGFYFTTPGSFSLTVATIGERTDEPGGWTPDFAADTHTLSAN